MRSHRNRRLDFRTVLVLGALVALLTTSTAMALEPEQRRRAERGELIIGFQDDAQNLDPRKARITPDLRVTTLIHNGLVRATSSGIVPELAESWEIPDLQTYVFHLHDGVTFHDGSELTSADVKFTYESMLDPEFASPHLGTYSIISEIETPDPLTVIFHLSEPSVSLLGELNRGIVSQAYAGSDPAAANLRPMGTGPYRFVEWVPNTSIELVANPDYFAGPVGFTSITFIPVVDNTVRTLRLETGAVDVIWTASPAEIQTLQRNPDLNVFQLEGSTADFVQLNTCAPPLDDVRVRQAIMHGINQEELGNAVYFGGVAPGASPIVPSSAFHEPDTAPLEYDPERARQLLAEAGHGGGLTLELEHLASVDVQQYSQLLQAQLAAVGITLELKPREAGTIIRDWTTNNYEMMSFGLGNRYDPDAILYPRYHSTQRAPEGNNTCYANPQVDRLLDEARAEPDFDQRFELYSQVQKVVVHELPIIILTYKPEFLVAPQEISNLSYDPFSLFYDLATTGSWRLD
jgi:peptide/nickel transport system substrate-binding protein